MRGKKQFMESLSDRVDMKEIHFENIRGLPVP